MSQLSPPPSRRSSPTWPTTSWTATADDGARARRTGMTALRDKDLVDDVATAIASARSHLAGRQHAAGWWKGELRTNVTMDAEDLLLRQFLGILRDHELDESARWIRSQQRTDGTWATFEDGPGDLSTTIEAYAALRLAGDGSGEPHMAAAREFILAGGGIEASRVFTRLWLALF